MEMKMSVEEAKQRAFGAHVPGISLRAFHPASYVGGI